MPVVRISDATLAGIRTLDQWFEAGTPSAVIDRLVREGMEKYDLEVERPNDTPSYLAPAEGGHNIPHLFTETPGLTHTKCIDARVDGMQLANPKWSSILIAAIAAVKSRGHTGRDLASALQINASPSRLESNGYKFYPNIGISVQGQSAPDAWREAARLAEKFDFDISVEFVWREKEGAAFPGQVGKMTIGKAE